MTRKPLDGELMELTPEQFSKLRDGSMRGVSMRMDIGTPNGDSTAIQRLYHRKQSIRKIMHDEAHFNLLDTGKHLRKLRSIWFNENKPLQCLQCGASCGPNGELPPCNHGE